MTRAIPSRARLLTATAVAAATFVLASPVWAAKDVIYPSATNAGSGTWSIGANGHVQLGSVAPGAPVSFNLTWSIQSHWASTGTNTGYSRSVNFASVVVNDAGVVSQLVSLGGSPCSVGSSAATCTTLISFTAPVAAGNYRARVTSADNNTGQGSNNNINGTQVDINFTVAAPVAQAVETRTEAWGPYCANLNGAVDFRATLTTADTPPVGIAGKLIDFGLESAPGSNTIVGITAVATESSGDAVLSGVSLLGRGVGDYTVKAAFSGDSQYLASHDTATLGIQYMFLGFQPPINPDGTSVFGNGRVIPIKIRISDALGNPVTTAAPTVWIKKQLEGGGYLDENEAASVSAADTGNVMRYSPTDDQYIYNMDLSQLSNGIYVIRVDLGSAACRSDSLAVPITVKKRKG